MIYRCRTMQGTMTASVTSVRLHLIVITVKTPCTVTQYILALFAFSCQKAKKKQDEK